ncbi:MAG TPA: amino acid-binding protein, partial [Oxalobacteraceae bacterium]|nr:amino acid-binding protein [Oxalobacteraceae bacterium]
GPNAAIGRDYVAGIKTHFDAINSAGGINGKHIQYIVRDDQGEPGLSVAMATELIERDQVDYLFGGVGDDITRAVLEAPAFKRSGQILYAPLAASELGGSHVLFWRPGYKQEISYIFAYFGKLGLKSVGIVYQDSAANQDAFRSLNSEIKAHRMQLTGVAHVKSGGSQAETDMEAKLLAVSRPGFVIVIADTISTALFLKQFRNYAANVFVAGTSLINLSTLREVAGAKAVEWTVFSQVVPNPNSATSLIQVEHLNMMRKYRDEAVSSLTLEGFAAAKTLTKAIQQAKHSRSALQELITQDGDIDLGGLSIGVRPHSDHLSSYLDIALFNKGSGLMF